MPGRVAMCVSLSLGLIIVFAGPAAARPASTTWGPMTPVRTGNASEISPASDAPWLAWSQNSNAHPRHFDAFAKRTGDPKFRVNPPGTQAFAGGIDGTDLIYQRVRNGRSDLKLYDLGAGMPLPLPGGVNTDHREYSATNSGDYLLFGRDNAHTGANRVMLFNTNTETDMVLASQHSPNAFVFPGQVSGDYAVYYRCGNTCNVFVYDIMAGGTPTKIPNPNGKLQYAPSVAASGFVFFLRSGFACGRNVHIKRYDIMGASTSEIAPLPAARDAFGTYTDDNGTLDVYYDRLNCSHGAANIHVEMVP
jgi:hypothetical protein